MYFFHNGFFYTKAFPIEEYKKNSSTVPTSWDINHNPDYQC